MYESIYVTFLKRQNHRNEEKNEWIPEIKGMERK